MARRASAPKQREARRTENNLIKNILAMKVNAFGSGVDQKSLLDYLSDNADNVRAGQKRIVIDNPENSNEVLKVSYTLDGLYDNMNDVICYNTLLDLEKDGRIEPDDLKLFNDARLLNDDPMIIVETAQTTYRDCKEFKDWYDDNKHKYADLYQADLWAVYISTISSLRRDYNRIQSILAEYFVPSDGTITVEPDNYGIWYEGNQMRLIFYDMGSVVPILNRELPICPECGADLRYVPIELDDKRGGLSHEDAEMLEGVYGCTSSSCRFYGEKIYSLKTGRGKVRDSRIYAEYCDSHQRYLDELYATECNYYIPEVRVYSYESYVREVEDVIRLTASSREYNIMYQNYLCYEIGGIFQGLSFDLEDLKAKVYKKSMSFKSFIKEWDDLIADVLQIKGNKLTDTAAAVAYLDAISDEGTVIQDVLNSRDMHDFEDVVLDISKIDYDNQDDIYDDIDEMWELLKEML